MYEVLRRLADERAAAANAAAARAGVRAGMLLVDEPRTVGGGGGGCALEGDLNADGTWNVLDIVALANCVLASNCG